MIELASAAGLGIALGVVTGMPLGVINVAIIDAAVRAHTRFATGMAIGGAIADTTHAAIAFVGIGRAISVHPSWAKVMALVAAIAIAGYALLASRMRVEAPAARRHGVATGLALTLPNPAALSAWLAVAALVWPEIAIAPALVLAAGVGIGSALWFVLLARWVAKLPAGARVRRIAPKLALVLLVAIAIGGCARAWLA